MGNGAANILDGGVGTDILQGGLGNDIYIINDASEHTAAEITDSKGTADEIRFTSEIADQTLTLYAGDTGVDRIVMGTGTEATAVTTGTTNLRVDASRGVNALTIIGNSGDNLLVGTNFNDNIQAGAGNDSLNGGLGNDTLIGGLGDDLYYVNSASDVVTEAVGAGTDEVISSASTYTLSANVETLTLSNGTGVLTGIGNDTNNAIFGNDYNNTLNGGLGNDTLNGGQGNDTYVFNTALSSNNVDSINYSDSDRIALEDSIFIKLKGDTDLSDNIVNGSGALDGNDYLIYNPLTGALSYDSNGIVSGELIQFAWIDHGLTIDSSDFILV